jgi:hypothetical protein
MGHFAFGSAQRTLNLAHRPPWFAQVHVRLHNMAALALVLLFKNAAGL